MISLKQKLFSRQRLIKISVWFLIAVLGAIFVLGDKCYLNEHDGNSYIAVRICAKELSTYPYFGPGTYLYTRCIGDNVALYQGCTTCNKNGCNGEKVQIGQDWYMSALTPSTTRMEFCCYAKTGAMFVWQGMSWENLQYKSEGSHDPPSNDPPTNDPPGSNGSSSGIWNIEIFIQAIMDFLRSIFGWSG
jgi:hypothetical protein